MVEVFAHASRAYDATPCAALDFRRCIAGMGARTTQWALPCQLRFSQMRHYAARHIEDDLNDSARHSGWMRISSRRALQ